MAAHGAVLAALPSGVWRVAIAFGWDSGFEGLLAPENFPAKESFYLLGLSLAAELLALLTLGLVHRWGEVLPEWVPGLGGRRVPALPATAVALAGAAALTFFTFTGAMAWADADNMGAPDAPDGGLWWVMTAAYAPLVLWGPLLAVVAVAYYRRRRRTG
ncbi:hypothetical protein [Streptomyces sp. NPDC058657]|uniref:hypothetical protein n=1 Tax=unclassified Streptomyces TaxID=2593676 RepID=UPI00364DA096